MNNKELTTLVKKDLVKVGTATIGKKVLDFHLDAELHTLYMRFERGEFCIVSSGYDEIGKVYIELEDYVDLVIHARNLNRIDVISDEELENVLSEYDKFRV